MFVYAYVGVPVVSCGMVVSSPSVLVVGDDVLVVGDGVLVVGDGVLVVGDGVLVVGDGVLVVGDIGVPCDMIMVINMKFYAYLSIPSTPTYLYTPLLIYVQNML